MINIRRRGNQVRGIVEGINSGLATVRLSGSGARLTNLEVSGDLPVVGDSVYVDYSSGSPPYVYVANKLDPEILAPEPALRAPAKFTEDESITLTDDIYCSVHRISNYSIGRNTWFVLPFEKAEYDSNGLWDHGNKIVIPMTGIYYAVCRIAFDKINLGLVATEPEPPTSYWYYSYPGQPQGRCGIRIYINSDEEAEVIKDSIHTGRAYNIFDCDAIFQASQNDEITIKVFQDVASSLTLIQRGVIYPNLKVHFLSAL